MSFPRVHLVPERGPTRFTGQTLVQVIDPYQITLASLQRDLVAAGCVIWPPAGREVWQPHFAFYASPAPRVHEVLAAMPLTLTGEPGGAGGDLLPGLDPKVADLCEQVAGHVPLGDTAAFEVALMGQRLSDLLERASRRRPAR